MLNQMTHTLGPIDPAAIPRAEREIGAPFPEEYKRFLLKYNGGRPQPADFLIHWGGQDWADQYPVGVVDVFLGFRSGEQTDFFHRLEVYRERIPADTIPIADDPGGSLLLLGVRGSNTGRVFFWAHDYEVDEAQSADYSNIGIVAPDFDALLQCLHDA